MYIVNYLAVAYSLKNNPYILSRLYNNIELVPRLILNTVIISISITRNGLKCFPLTYTVLFFFFGFSTKIGNEYIISYSAILHANSCL